MAAIFIGKAIRPFLTFSYPFLHWFLLSPPLFYHLLLVGGPFLLPQKYLSTQRLGVKVLMHLNVHSNGKICPTVLRVNTHLTSLLHAITGKIKI